MFCMKCGAQVEEDDNFCMVCGFDLKHPETILQKDAEESEAAETVVEETPVETAESEVVEPVLEETPVGAARLGTTESTVEETPAETAEPEVAETDAEEVPQAEADQAVAEPETTQVEPEEVPTAEQETETAQIASEDAPQPTTQKLGEGYGDAVLRFKCPVCNSPFNGSETDRTCPICKKDTATIDLKDKGILALYRIYNGRRDQPPLALNLQIVPENEKVSFFIYKNNYGGVAINQRVNVVLPFGRYRFPNGRRTMYFEITPENPIFYATFRTPLFAPAQLSDMPEENRIPMYDD